MFFWGRLHEFCCFCLVIQEYFTAVPVRKRYFTRKMDSAIFNMKATAKCRAVPQFSCVKRVECGRHYNSGDTRGNVCVPRNYYLARIRSRHRTNLRHRTWHSKFPSTHMFHSIYFSFRLVGPKQTLFAKVPVPLSSAGLLVWYIPALARSPYFWFEVVMLKVPAV